MKLSLIAALALSVFDATFAAQTTGISNTLKGHSFLPQGVEVQLVKGRGLASRYLQNVQSTGSASTTSPLRLPASGVVGEAPPAPVTTSQVQSAPSAAERKLTTHQTFRQAGSWIKQPTATETLYLTQPPSHQTPKVQTPSAAAVSASNQVAAGAQATVKSNRSFRMADSWIQQPTAAAPSQEPVETHRKTSHLPARLTRKQEQSSTAATTTTTTPPAKKKKTSSSSSSSMSESTGQSMARIAKGVEDQFNHLVQSSGHSKEHSSGHIKTSDSLRQRSGELLNRSLKRLASSGRSKEKQISSDAQQTNSLTQSGQVAKFRKSNIASRYNPEERKQPSSFHHGIASEMAQIRHMMQGNVAMNQRMRDEMERIATAMQAATGKENVVHREITWAPPPPPKYHLTTQELGIYQAELGGIEKESNPTFLKMQGKDSTPLDYYRKFYLARVFLGPNFIPTEKDFDKFVDVSEEVFAHALKMGKRVQQEMVTKWLSTSIINKNNEQYIDFASDGMKKYLGGWYHLTSHGLDPEFYGYSSNPFESFDQLRRDKFAMTDSTYFEDMGRRYCETYWSDLGKVAFKVSGKLLKKTLIYPPLKPFFNEYTDEDTLTPVELVKVMKECEDELVIVHQQKVKAAHQRAMYEASKHTNNPGK